MSDKDLPDELQDHEIIQMMAAQKTVMDHHEQLEDEYKENILAVARTHGREDLIFEMYRWAER